MALDALYVADPANAYYLQDPTGAWRGQEHVGALIKHHAEHYARVLVVGSSMGGTAALLHAGLGDRVLAFGPRIELRRTHGSFVPAAVQGVCLTTVLPSIRQAAARRAHVAVHVGSGNLEDVLQAEHVQGTCSALY